MAGYNPRMINIRQIKPNEAMAAKRIVYRVAHEIFNDKRSLDEMIEILESHGELKDMDDIQKGYFENDGVFLVMTDDGQIICTGAIRRFDGKTCELKRLWLLTEYHGKGLGYQMIQELLSFARKKGYERIRLETDPNSQKRAVKFYKRLGFQEVPIANATDDEDILMEMQL